MAATPSTTSTAPPLMTAREHGVENGVQWATVNAPFYGGVNGYARIPEGHPWSGLDYDEIDVEAPGGLTFARDGWIGFDTMHAWDLWEGGEQPHFCRGECTCIKWTAEKVADAARALAQRVAEASS
jgi:hypothetical protein